MLKNTSLWCFITDADKGGLQRTRDIVAQNKADAKLSTITKENQAELKDCYANAQLYDWFLKQRKTAKR